MRKQYHFWSSESGILAWDVQRLIELSQGLPRKCVALSQIGEIDEVYWFDGHDERPTCRKVLEHMKLIQEVDLSFPVILAADGRVMDGMHRVARALSEDREGIEAVQFERTPDPDYVDCNPKDLPY